MVAVFEVPGVVSTVVPGELSVVVVVPVGSAEIVVVGIAAIGSSAPLRSRRKPTTAVMAMTKTAPTATAVRFNGQTSCLGDRGRLSHLRSHR